MDKVKFKAGAFKPLIKKPPAVAALNEDMPRHPHTGRFVARSSFHASNNPNGSRPTQ